MIHLLLLIFLTLLIGFQANRIVKLSNSWYYLATVFFLYFWSLMGSWFFIIDNLTNNGLKAYGLHYYHIFDLLFKVELDMNYLLLILFYGFFIISFQFFVIRSLKKSQVHIEVIEKHNTVELNVVKISILSFVCILFSFLIVFDDIMYAIKFGDSIYTTTRNSASKFYTLHQILNQIAIVLVFFSFIVMIDKRENPKFIVAQTGWSKITIVSLFLIVVVYLTCLGNKHELLTAGIFSILYFFDGKRIFRKQNLPILWIIPFFVLPLMFNDPIRALLPKIINQIMNVDDYQLSEETIKIMKNSGYGEQDLGEISSSAFLSVFFSNEMFYSQFSLYGILLFKVPLLWGTSFLSLITSIVPKIFGLPRYMDSYTYYSIMTHAKQGQGYTINHIAAWYLNFGFIGILLGASVLAAFFIYPIKLIRNVRIPKKFSTFIYLTPFLLAAFIPNLVRTGPEGYKALILEGVLIPLFFIWFSKQKNNADTSA